MNRRTLALAAALSLLMMQACSSGPEEGSGPGPLAPVRTLPIGHDFVALAGLDRVIAVLDRGSPPEILGSVHLASITDNPLEMSDLGTVTLTSTVDPVDDLVVTEDWVTVSCGGVLSVISLATATPKPIATFAVGSGVHAIASGSWLLYADAAARLFVRDLDSPALGFPQVGPAIDAGAPVTSVASLPAGFLVFTSGGFGYVDMSSGIPAYTFTASSDLRLFSKVIHPFGALIFAGGPAPQLGRTRVAMITFYDPSAPEVVAVADVDGVFVDLALNESASTPLVLLQSPDPGVQRLVVIRWSQESVRYDAPRDLPNVRRGNTSVVHARNGTFYAPYAETGSDMPGSLAVFQLP